jgi:hypothetical protein
MLVAIVEDPATGAELGIADFLWSEGLQGGYDDWTRLVHSGHRVSLNLNLD